MLEIFEFYVFLYFVIYFIGCDVQGAYVGIEIPDKLLSELYSSYKESLHIEEGTVSFRRIFADNKKYQIHVMKLTEVNGKKRHNLLIKEDNSTNPLIYIDNPVETKVPNAFLTYEEFKKELTDRVLRQRNKVLKPASKYKQEIHTTLRHKHTDSLLSKSSKDAIIKKFLNNLDIVKRLRKSTIGMRSGNIKLVVTQHATNVTNNVKVTNVSNIHYKRKHTTDKRGEVTVATSKLNNNNKHHHNKISKKHTAYVMRKVTDANNSNVTKESNKRTSKNPITLSHKHKTDVIETHTFAVDTSLSSLNTIVTTENTIEPELIFIENNSQALEATTKDQPKTTSKKAFKTKFYFIESSKIEPLVDHTTAIDSTTKIDTTIDSTTDIFTTTEFFSTTASTTKKTKRKRPSKPFVFIPDEREALRGMEYV